ncbi:hypothetical protein V1477_008183 [Vespula maculifrons]|uniref:Uncharacterized protein n=1 Tax=Vespula maculifrons TaxID=7453 RepID=A0ABD2CD68_VESMC
MARLETERPRRVSFDVGKSPKSLGVNFRISEDCGRSISSRAALVSAIFQTAPTYKIIGSHNVEKSVIKYQSFVSESFVDRTGLRYFLKFDKILMTCDRFVSKGEKTMTKKKR